MRLRFLLLLAALMVLVCAHGRRSQTERRLLRAERADESAREEKSMRRLLIACCFAVCIVISSAVIADTGMPHPTQPDARTWPSKEECEKATGKPCDFVMCDYIPPGKRYEEVCGNVGKGWQPLPDWQDNAPR